MRPSLNQDLLRRALEIKKQLVRAGVEIHVEALLVVTKGTLVVPDGAVDPRGNAIDYVTVVTPQDLVPVVESRRPATPSG